MIYFAHQWCDRTIKIEIGTHKHEEQTDSHTLTNKHGWPQCCLLVVRPYFVGSLNIQGSCEYLYIGVEK